MTQAPLLTYFERIADAPDALPRLRRFILDLAVRGKLVEQDPMDEPASELLKRIRTKNARLVKAGERKEGRPLPEPSDEDQPFELPDGWAWARFGDVYVLEYGDNLPARNRSNTGEYPVYGSNGIVGTHATCFVNSPCIVVGRKGSAGALNLSSTEGCCVTDVAYYCIPPREVDLAFSFKLFHTLGLDTLGKGIKPGLNRNEAYSLLFALPPLAEQHRIVAKVNELMALFDRLEAAQGVRETRRGRLTSASLQRLNQPVMPGREGLREHARFHLNHLLRLTARPDQITGLRQAIVNLAVRGQLVPQNPKDESARLLLDRLTTDVKVYARDQGMTPSKPAPIAEESTPCPAPSGWVWVRLCSLFKVITDGDHQPPPKSEDGVAFLTIGNITTGRLDFSDCRFVAREYWDSLATYRRPACGDILYTVVGATYGRPAFVDTQREFCVQRHIAILKPTDEINVKFLCYLLASPMVYEQATRSTTGTAQPTIPLRPLRNFLVLLPPLAEQNRIVAKVDQLMAICDQLTVQLMAVQTEGNRLLQAALHEALAVPVAQARAQMVGNRTPHERQAVQMPPNARGPADPALI
jgi:type I restriction enzyme S subunit